MPIDFNFPPSGGDFLVVQIIKLNGIVVDINVFSSSSTIPVAALTISSRALLGSRSLAHFPRYAGLTSLRFANIGHGLRGDLGGFLALQSAA